MAGMAINLGLVASGGALGAMLRYLTVLGLHRFGGGFPLGTLAVNVIGSTAMGFAAAWLFERGAASPRLALFLMTGLFGGFTTFSAFSLDVVALIERGEAGRAALYVALSLALSIGGFWGALTLARSL